MADGYDRFDNDSGGGGGAFVMGLLTGTVLGAGLGMLFAPKAGSELRSQISEQAGNFANSAAEGYRRASETAGEWADKGRAAYDKARDAVSRGADEAKQYVRDSAGGGPTGQQASGSFGSGSYATGSGPSTPGSSGTAHDKGSSTRRS